MSIQYKIKSGDEEKGAEATIIKTGSEIEFTVHQIDLDVAFLEKNKKEILGQVGIEKATMQNIQNTHPHICEMSPEDLTAAYLFRQATGYLNMADEKLAEIERQLKDYAQEKEEIIKQTGLTLKKDEQGE